MARKETDHSVPSFSMPEEDFQKFEAWWKGKFGSRQAAINEAVKLIMTDKMREVLPDQAANIDQFELHIGKIVDAYRASLEWSSTADERARREVAAQLEGMATLSKTNERLNAENSELLKKNAELEKFIADQAEKIKKLEAELTSISYDTQEVADLKKRCADLTQEKADILASHNAEIAALQKENFANILEVIKAGSKQ